MEKNEFIEILMRNNPKEINEMIQNKGKDAKPICPVIFRGKVKDDK